MERLHYSQHKIIGTLVASQSLLSISMLVIFAIASIQMVALAGGDARWAGVPSTLMLVGSALVSYPAGRLMDKAGRRLGLALGHLVGIFGAGLTAWAIIQSSMWLFILGIFVLGVARGPLELGRYAAADVTGPARSGRAISLVVLGGVAGSIAGPALMELGKSLSPRFGLPLEAAPWLMAGFFFIVGVILIVALLRPDPLRVARYLAQASVPATSTEPQRAPSAVRETRTALRDVRIQLATGTMIFSQLAMVIVMTITPLHMDHEHHADNAIAWVITAHTLGMFGFSIVIGWLSDKVGRSRTILIGGLISTLACLLAPFSTSAVWLGITLFLLGLGWNFCFVAGSALLNDALLPGERGSWQGSVDGAVKIASGVGSLGSGLLFSASSFALTSWLTLIAAIVPALLVVLLAARQEIAEPMAESITTP